ncbi:MAG: beta-galactosidase trimerization domain-containing protein, partial [Chloroflexi bacterium]|nr:beta-galactosidase trimerization domain-containing protein [Chloroflexota bacterium]
ATSPVLADTTSDDASVAILNSYPSRWSIESQRHHVDFDYVEHLVHHYRAFAARNVAVDIVAPGVPLDRYRVVVAPALVVLHDGAEALLQRFVERGGHLVLTIRSALKDADNAFFPMRQPGPLSELAGVEVEDYYALSEPIPIEGDDISGTTRMWAERLALRDGDATPAEVLARFGPGLHWLGGHPAVTVRRVGTGSLTYVGGFLDTASQQALTDRILATAGVRPILATPPGVEARTRRDPEGREVLILINHGQEATSVGLPWPAVEHVSLGPVGESVRLAPDETAVLTRVRG